MSNYVPSSNTTALKITQAHLSTLHGNQIQRAERLFSLGNLVSGVCHELNNTLNALSMNAELGLLLLSKDQDKDQDKLKSIFRTMVEEVKRSGTLTRGILDFSKKGNYAPTQNGDLNDALARAKKLTDSLLRRSKSQLELQQDNDLPELPLSLVAVAQAVANIIHNAVEAGASHVRIGTEYDKTNILLTVTDNGSGISTQVLPHIFEPFFTTRATQGNLGLGLSLTQRIIRDHDGQIDVHSLPDTGTRFVVKLPLNHLDGLSI
jgi:signal transduction histidine kinase